ncbi:hypothetical protein DK526_24840 [Salmonella enterica]|nr:hypothetical protein [Salmonella enterica]
MPASDPDGQIQPGCGLAGEQDNKYKAVKADLRRASLALLLHHRKHHPLTRHQLEKKLKYYIICIYVVMTR